MRFNTVSTTLIIFLVLGAGALTYLTFKNKFPWRKKESASPVTLIREKFANPKAPAKKPGELLTGNFKVLKTDADLQSAYGKEWILEHSGDGRVKRFYGGAIPLQDVTPEKLVEFANSVAPLLDLNSDALADEAYPVDPQSNSGHQVFSIPQKLSDYPIYGADLRLAIDIENQSVTGIDGINLGRTTAGLEAKPKSVQVIEALAKKKEPGLNLTNAALKVFINEDGIPRLAYQGTNSPPNSVGLDTKMILVDAETGKILHREPMALQ